jgi:hypothetical protein
MPAYLDASLFLQVANQRNGLEILGDVASNESSAALYTVGLLLLTDGLLCIRCEIWSVIELVSVRIRAVESELVRVVGSELFNQEE